MAPRTKTLFTTPVLEHPPAGGPALRIENTIKALGAITELHVVSRAGPAAVGGRAAETFLCSLAAAFGYAPLLDAGDRPEEELRNARAIIAYARDHGIRVVWCGYGNVSFHLMCALRAIEPRLKIVCDTDSVWSRFVLREAPFAAEPQRKQEIEAEGLAKERQERQWVEFCDVTTAVSDVDAEYYRRIASDPRRIHRFSNVIDIDAYRRPPPPAPDLPRPAMFLSGSFYAAASPMAHAARWFIGQVMPAIQRSIPEISLVVVGNGADRVLADMRRPGVMIKGKVPSVLPYLCHCDVALVPLHFESGTRFKILEAGACGIPIVSTTLGAEGLPARHAAELLIADDPDDFARAVVRLLRDRDLAARLTAACRRMVWSRFSIPALREEARSILSFLETPSR
jgi:glycosyltransferase involved in cell wall biosynthesis